MLDKIIEDLKEFKQVSIDLDPAGRERLLQAALGLTLGEAENVFAKIIVKDGRLSGEHISEVFAEKQQIIRKSGLLEYCATSESFAEVGGLAVLKDWLNKRALAFSPEARAFGLPVPKGLLMLGVQGCGKSLCAKAVSTQWQLPLLRFDMGRMFNSFIGSSEENVRRAIAVAESVAPAILWVDEIDKAFAGSQGSGASRRRHHRPGLRDLSDLAFRKTGPRIRGGHRQRHLPTAARAAPQRAAGRNLLCRFAGPGGTRGGLPHPPPKTRA